MVYLLTQKEHLESGSPHVFKSCMYISLYKTNIYVLWGYYSLLFRVLCLFAAIRNFDANYSKKKQTLK